jgi:hypothetical protein
MPQAELNGIKKVTGRHVAIACTLVMFLATLVRFAQHSFRHTMLFRLQMTGASTRTVLRRRAFSSRLCGCLRPTLSHNGLSKLWTFGRSKSYHLIRSRTHTKSLLVISLVTKLTRPVRTQTNLTSLLLSSSNKLLWRSKMVSNTFTY